MANPPTPPGMNDKNPADIAREAFRRLATRRIAPTPEAYREIYNEIAGLVGAEPVAAGEALPDPGAENVLAGMASQMTLKTGELAEFGRRFTRALKARDWEAYAKHLSQLIEKHVVASKGMPIEVAGSDDNPEARQLRDLLSRTLTFAVASLLSGAPELAQESEALGAAVKTADEAGLNEVSTRLKQLCFQIELKSGDLGEQQELLMRLFKLLLENIGNLLDDDSWLKGQIEVVQNAIMLPLNHRMLEDATRSLKEVIYKQSQLKNSLSDVKLTVKNMMMTFIDRLGQMATTTGDYHEKIGGYSTKISQANDIKELNTILDEVLTETRAVQNEALKSREKMVEARQEVEDAEKRVMQLEAKLQHLSELVREDQLTGSLNRRGLDDVFERELARSERRGTPLCVALLDLDNFKKLNDTYGHMAGDNALKHLVKIVKETLRQMDVIARFGGEEFLIVLPETTAEAAAATMTRVQRELTRHFFMHDNEKLVITFSCGVALRRPNEDQQSLVERADKAMYQAKTTGKNRVVVAD